MNPTPSPKISLMNSFLGHPKRNPPYPHRERCFWIVPLNISGRLRRPATNGEKFRVECVKRTLTAWNWDIWWWKKSQTKDVFETLLNNVIFYHINWLARFFSIVFLRLIMLDVYDQSGYTITGAGKQIAIRFFSRRETYHPNPSGLELASTSRT